MSLKMLDRLKELHGDKIFLLSNEEIMKLYNEMIKND